MEVLEVFVAFTFAVVFLIGFPLLFDALQRRQAEKVTKDELIKKCKKHIDAGRFDKLSSTLLLHSKLYFLYFNELQITLSEYISEVDLKVHKD